MSPRRLFVPATLFMLLASTGSLLGQDGTQRTRVERALDSLEWREIGPANMGGRTVDIAGIPGDPSTIYMATASGGLWVTRDGGTKWSSIFDDGGTLSLGAVALAPSDHNVIYLGTGEHNPRNSASIGDGVYRSTDAGQSWTHIGLAETEKTGRIRVHPTDPNVVYVAAMGHEWGANAQRGVFRSIDGGQTWDHVLFVNATTGAADLAMDPNNPRILYAAMYDHLRRPWNFRSGGPGSGLYRSTDGGGSWERLTHPEADNGLPTDTLGRIGLATAASEPGVVYAMMESKQGVLWRSDDYGDSWQLMSRESRAISRPFYYTDIRVDPTDENTLYAVAGSLMKSIDAGRTWTTIARNIHGDHQSLWIDPQDPDRIVNGNDGGFHFSFDGGESWELMNTVPLGQFYHVEVDNRWPYRVCGGLQDNDVWCGPSKTWTVTGPLIHDWYEIAGPGDGMYVEIDPRNDDLMYTTTQNGGIERVDLRTGENRPISPHPLAGGGQAADAREIRFNWNTPLHLSPHDPDVLFVGANRLFRTADGGQSWEALSPDLSKADSTKLVSSGGLSPDNSGAEHHATIFTVAQSPMDARIIWAGTDDGNVQVTQDGGTTWTNVAGNVPNLPDESWISHIEASRADPGRAYMTVDRHRSDDHSTRVYRTDNFGLRWTPLTEGFPANHYAHVVREDPRNPDVLYLGTELGIWTSLDRGESWSSLRLNLPPVAVRDIKIHERDNDIVIATHGRSLWVLDDATVLQELAAALDAPAHLFTPREAIRFMPWAKRFSFDIGDRIFIGDNPEYGAILSFSLSEDAVERLASEATSGTGVEEPGTGDAPGQSGAPGEGGASDGGGGAMAEVTIQITDADGVLVRELDVPAAVGVNRTAWDLRHGFESEDDEDGDNPFSRAPQGPAVVPGIYTAHLIVGEDTIAAPVPVRLDPRHEVPMADLVAQRDGILEIMEVDRRITEAVDVMDAAKEQIDGLADRLKEGEEHADMVAELEAVADSISDLKGRLVSSGGGGAMGQAQANVQSDLRSVSRAMGSATTRPTDAQAEWAARLTDQAESLLREATELTGARLDTLNEALQRAGIRLIGGTR